MNKSSMYGLVVALALVATVVLGGAVAQRDEAAPAGRSVSAVPQQSNPVPPPASFLDCAAC
jgi:hypothetical protein